jgi:hypothetical protein
MLPEFETKDLVKFKTSNPCCYEHKTNPSPLQIGESTQEAFAALSVAPRASFAAFGRQ